MRGWGTLCRLSTKNAQVRNKQKSEKPQKPNKNVFLVS